MRRHEGDERRVAVVESYAYGDALEAAPDTEFVAGRSDQDNLDRLMRREVDYMLADELLIHELFERSGGRAESLLEAGKFPIVERSLHFAIRKDLPGAAGIVKGFDESIREMMTDGLAARCSRSDLRFTPFGYQDVAQITDVVVDGSTASVTVASRPFQASGCRPLGASSAS